MPERAEARFPSVPREKGHYESFYIRACHPSEPLGVWIRHTVHKRPGQAPKGSMWFVLFDAAADGPVASKTFTDELSAGDGSYIRVADGSFGPGLAEGSARSEQADPSWRLEIATDEEPFPYLPAGWMYRAPVPRTKAECPYPNARFDGRVEVGGRTIDVEGWRGMVGHNWGAEHAERWIWTQGTLFDGGAWFDATLGRIKIGPLTTPWVANAAITIDGVRHRLGGPGRKTTVDERPDGAEFTLSGKGVKLRGRVGADRKDFVGWVYADPDGPEHNTVNCSIASMTLTVERDGRDPVELHTPHGAAYELGMRETDHGIPLQPFPDG
ncbi:MAG: hypothetical protein M3340_05665 [Actinomycetota bacterium]|nr:hypothetical protein [Actinomycetota bacterium]